MSVIDEFLENYRKNRDFHKECARICDTICETNMEQRGIRGIVTYRAKKIDRLRDKLEKRAAQKNYLTIEEIKEDIVDLSGVRIDLYFPGDLNKVQQLIEANFIVVECKTFPEPNQNDKQPANEYKKRFSGYWATHYRVYLKDKDIPRNLKKYPRTIIEIQIASALMHAWAEVQHDLVYKPFSGELSYEEYQILDEINGLVLAGEIAFERLQNAVNNRVSQAGKEFNNHYEMAMFLYNKLGTSEESDTVLGRVDLLFSCLKTSEYNRPESFMEILRSISAKTNEKPIVDQIIDKIGENNPQIYDSYMQMKRNEELKYQMETLRMNRENGNRQGEANTLANIGYIYLYRENYDEAIAYFSKAVEINNEIGSIQGEGNQLLNLGSAYRLKGDCKNALSLCNSAIALHRKIDYKQGEANALGIIGNIYSDDGYFVEAKQYYDEAAAIYKETNYRIGEANQLSNMGALAIKEGQVQQAIEYYNLAYKIYAESDYKQGQADTLYHMGNIYFEQKKLSKASGYYKRALSIQESAGSQKIRIGILINIGKVCALSGDEEEAMGHFKEAFLISSNIEYKYGEEEAIENITRLSNYEK